MNKPKTLGGLRCAGFTLLEAIVVIVITGIIAGMVAVFIRSPIDSYVESTRRAELTDAADTALRRITRDVRTALPNSFRSVAALASAGGSSCVEFLPTVGGGRYRVAKNASSVGDILDFSTTDTSFDVLARNNFPDSSAWPGTRHVVIYNLGLEKDDAYAADNNRAQIQSVTTTAGSTLVTLATGKKFPHESPGRRFHAIPDYSVIYSCSAGVLYRSTQPILASAPSCPTTGSVLISNVDCANTNFKYTVVSAINSLLAITLTLKHAQSGESVRIYHEVQVSNVP